MRRSVVLALIASTAICICGHAAPDLSNGVQVLAMLADPYGANTYLLKDQFELLGWEVTLMGIDRSVPACSRLCSTLFADASVDEIESATAYDVLVVMPTPGTFQRVRDPVGDLRGSEHAVALVQEAYAGGASLYTGCSGILLFGDAGVLDGASVIAHPNRMANCTSFGANCTRGAGQQVGVGRWMNRAATPVVGQIRLVPDLVVVDLRTVASGDSASESGKAVRIDRGNRRSIVEDGHQSQLGVAGQRRHKTVRNTPVKAPRL